MKQAWADGKAANDAGRAVESRGKINHSMKEDFRNGREKTVSHVGNVEG